MRKSRKATVAPGKKQKQRKYAQKSKKPFLVWYAMFFGCVLLLFLLSFLVHNHSALFKSSNGKERMHIVAKYPHDEKAFTQGLLMHNGLLFESTGMFRQSSIRKINPKTAEIIHMAKLPSHIFGEGMALWKNQLIVLSYKAKLGFVYNQKTLKLIKTFPYSTITTEGWGITHNDEMLIVSDGSNFLYFWDPHTFKEVKRIQVMENNDPVYYVNELEFVNGFVYANVWMSNDVIKIDPVTGKVVSRIDCSDLVKKAKFEDITDAVLNGIAYDQATDHFYLTGKLWDSMFKVKFL